MVTCHKRGRINLELDFPRAACKYLSRCSPCQIQALAHIHQRAQRNRRQALVQLDGLLNDANLSENLLSKAKDGLHRLVRVALHFHPDRITNNGQTVARRMLADGLYRNQFETGVSNGSPTAFPGGERDVWERELFDQAYHAPEVKAHDRPKYGSLQLFPFSDGPSPRFGSCYFLLKQTVLHRSTLTFGDSHLKPDIVGTIHALEPILAALLQQVHDQGHALGIEGLALPDFLSYLAEDRHVGKGRDVSVDRGVDEGSGPTFTGWSLRYDPTEPFHTTSFGTHTVSGDVAKQPVGRVLDDYIEVQVHGPIELNKDIEKLVVDPAFRYTETGKQLKLLCDRYGIPLQWHRGFVLHVQSVPDDFRGPTMIPLSQCIADLTGTQYLDAAAIGMAAASLHKRPEDWKAFGSLTEVLRRLRQIWHVLVRFGQIRN